MVFAGRYLDRRIAGYLCEQPEEVASPAVGDRFRRASSGNYHAAIRLWADAMGIRRPREYTPHDAMAFLVLLGKVPTSFGKSSNRKPGREAIRETDEAEAIAGCGPPRGGGARDNPTPADGDDPALPAEPRPDLRLGRRQRRGRREPLRPALAARRAAEADPEREPWGNLLSALGQRAGLHPERSRLEPGSDRLEQDLVQPTRRQRLAKALRSGVGSRAEKRQNRRNDPRSSSASARFTSETDSSALNSVRGGQAGSPLVRNYRQRPFDRRPVDSR